MSGRFSRVVVALCCSVVGLDAQVLLHEELLGTSDASTAPVTVLNAGSSALFLYVSVSIGVRPWNGGSDLWTDPALSLIAPAVVGDVDGDGVEDFAHVDYQFPWPFQLTVRSGATGAVVESLDWNAVAPGDVPHPIRLGDLDGDGFEEVLIGGGIFDSHDLVAPPVQLAPTPIWVPDLFLWPGEFSDAAGVGDTDGDGVGDVVVGYGRCDYAAQAHGGCYPTDNYVVLFSGADGSFLNHGRLQGPDTTYGNDVLVLDDVTGDGRPEVLVSTFEHFGGDCTGSSLSWRGTHFVYDGSGGPRLDMLCARAFFGPQGAGVLMDWSRGSRLVGDVDADGFSDLGISVQRRRYVGGQPVLDGFLALLDGITFEPLFEVHHPFLAYDPPNYGAVAQALGDVDGDTVPDVAILDQARVHVLALTPLGTSLLGGDTPTLAGATPRIAVGAPVNAGDASVRFSTTDVPAGRVAVLVLSTSSVQTPVLGGTPVLTPDRFVVTQTRQVLDRVNAQVELALPANLAAGTTRYAQWVVVEPTAGGLHLAASPVLEVIVQP